MCLSLALSPAWAQTTASGGGGFLLRPSFEAALNYSDVRLDGQENRRDLITRLSPGVRISGNSGKTRLSLAYTMNALRHTRGDQPSEIQNALNSSLNTELVNGTAYLEASANVTSTSLDAFGTQSAQGSFVDSRNRAEVANVSVAPYVRGILGGVAVYDVKITAGATNTRRSKVGDSSTYGASASLSSNSGRSVLGWGLQGSRQRSEYRGQAGSTNDRATATLTIRPDTDLQFAVRAGREATNALGGDRRTYDTAGGGVTWTPSPRTTASFDTEHRYFGQSRKFALQYRQALSSLRFTLTRDVSGGTGAVQPSITLYQLLDALLLSRFPDSAQREAAVQEALDGRDPNTVVSGGFVSSSLSLQDKAEVGWSYGGPRLSLSLQGYAGSTKTLVDGAFSGEAVRQRSYTSTVGYKLTPLSALTLTGSRLMTLGSETRRGTDLKSLSLSYSDQPTRLVTTGLTLRYAVFNSTLNPYREIAATAAVSLRF